MQRCMQHITDAESLQLRRRVIHLPPLTTAHRVAVRRRLRVLHGECLFIAAAGEGECLATYGLSSFVEERVRLGGY